MGLTKHELRFLFLLFAATFSYLSTLYYYSLHVYSTATGWVFTGAAIAWLLLVIAGSAINNSINNPDTNENLEIIVTFICAVSVIAGNFFIPVLWTAGMIVGMVLTYILCFIIAIAIICTIFCEYYNG